MRIRRIEIIIADKPSCRSGTDREMAKRRNGTVKDHRNTQRRPNERNGRGEFSQIPGCAHSPRHWLCFGIFRSHLRDYPLEIRSFTKPRVQQVPFGHFLQEQVLSDSHSRYIRLM